MVCFGAVVSPKNLGLNVGNSKTIFEQSEIECKDGFWSRNRCSQVLLCVITW